MLLLLIALIISQAIQAISIFFLFYYLNRRIIRIENILIDIRNILEGTHFPNEINGEKRVKI